MGGRLQAGAAGMQAYRTSLGHAHLRVRDLDRAVAFYTRFLKLELIERLGGQFAFLSGSSAHHDVALQALGAGAPKPPRFATGLQHVAFEVMDRSAFAAAFHELDGAGVPVAAVDHGISWAMYFADPDGNGLEIYWDTRRESHGARAWEGRAEPLTVDRIDAGSMSQSLS